MSERAGPALLAARGLRAGYGDGVVLHSVDLQVDAGEVLAILGPNGAGKSTTLKALAGLVRPSAGTVRMSGRDLVGHRPSEIARCGLYLLPEGRAVFPNLDVRDNLRLATGAPERDLDERLDDVFEAFPALKERIHQVVGTMSGGERQMVALARAWCADPVVLLLDEPSLGLAPLVIDDVFEAIARFRDAGTAIVLVEQYVERALALADAIVVLDKGRVTASGSPQTMSHDDLAARYLGLSTTTDR